MAAAPASCKASGVAVDISHEALGICRANARAILGDRYQQRCRFVQGDAFSISQKAANEDGDCNVGGGTSRCGGGGGGEGVSADLIVELAKEGPFAVILCNPPYHQQHHHPHHEAHH
eukprot:CAMPEP_0205903592 /NCGR_PEP_ID=MMETSP1325-20131115/202_1 /ASSEMBLY_ACC=CAM_ASM_000708 /TAXON_ID=236786 /ORGANISM="Florenciella sp., Strain RCC1007" /LENGTH=116 /DNA_ID=CAMNT_0053269263 /DNA_START=1 /DNA_END=348 /DNA_ORIENTATION=-